MFPFGIILGFGNGFQPVAGFNWGAKQYDRTMRSYRFAAKMALLGSAVMAVLLAVFADPIIVLFAGEDPQMREIGKLCIISQGVTLPIHAWVAVVNMLCAGLGNATGAFLLATARQGLCFIPILFPMAGLWSEYGIGTVQAAADVLSLALGIPIAIYMVRKIKRAKQSLQQ